MNIPNLVFKLDVRKVDPRKDQQTCEFTLTWGERQLPAELKYPDELDTKYQLWQQAYIDYASCEAPLRGRIVISGTANLQEKEIQKLKQVERDAKRLQLVTAEDELLTEFYNWLGDGKLREIRETIESYAKLKADSEQIIDILLTCRPIELARLPWEQWEVVSKSSRKIRIAHTPAKQNVESIPQPTVHRSRARILAISGGGEGLKLAEDREALLKLKPLVEIQFVGGTPDEILTTIADEQGWDVLFFSGHSGEVQASRGTVSGMIEIVSGLSIEMKELKSCLKTAQSRGLQFAIFNSCDGLQIANLLIDLGLNQVVVMRAEIADGAANLFLHKFALSLKKYNDIHTSVIKACEALLDDRINYPSSYLIPCLFRRPSSTLFRIPPPWQHWLRLFRPKRYEVVALSLFTLASLLHPLQQTLLDQRVGTQAIYRKFTRSVTGNVTSISTSPPVAILEIDQASINQAMKEAGTYIANPIPQSYLAKLIRHLPKQSKVVGVDYILDRSQGKQGEVTKDLSNAIVAANKQGKRFIFGCTSEETKSLFVCNQFSLKEIVGTNIGDADTIIGHTNFSNTEEIAYYMPLLWQEREKNQQLPLAYWLAWLHYTRSVCIKSLPQVDCSATNSVLYKEARRHIDEKLPRLNRSGITTIGNALMQPWLHPIIDFSIPPNEVYTPISAQAFLQDPNTLSQETVLIVPGGYDEAGIGDEKETFNPPKALQQYFISKMTRGEQHAYLLYLFLKQRLVVSVPDLWSVWVAAIAGKCIVVFLQWRSSKKWAQTTSKQIKKLYQSPWFWLLGGTALYSWLCLELYRLSIAILLPIVLPTAVFWAYVLPPLMKREI